MKKIFFFGIISTALFAILSCTSENEQQTQSESKTLQLQRLSSSNVNSAKGMFDEMIKGEDYKRYKNARTSFVLNMNGNVVFLKTKAEYMSWISSNLHLTKFTSIDNFEKSLDEMVLKQSFLREKYFELYTILDSAEADEYLKIIQSGLGQTPTFSKANPCANTCMDACEVTLDNIENGTALNQAMYGGNPFTDAIIDAMYWSMWTSAVDALNMCMSSC